MSIAYKIDLTQPGRSYPHYWELCVGSCHAATILREDVRNQIRKAHDECGFKYLRFHGLFDDDMSVAVASLMGHGPVSISFFNVYSIFDFLLSIGMKPFVEIGFMPTPYASGDTTCFHYKGNVTMPKDLNVWSDFIRQFGQHLLDRYGAEEVSQWFFEVWNEPNLKFFFDGTQDDYFQLYKSTATALKSVSPIFRCGGPATSVNAWIPDFINFCHSENVPLDFISTHHYPTDDPLSSFGKNDETKPEYEVNPPKIDLSTLTPEQIQELVKKFMGNKPKNPRDILQKMTEKAKQEAGDYPLYYTEWNGAVNYDTNYQSAAVLHTLANNEGLVEGYSYWTVSDIFEELGLVGKVFSNAFGMQNVYGVAKPVYRIFQTLHEAGAQRLTVEGEPHRTAEVMALSDGNKVTIFAYNHDIEARDIQTETMELCLNGKLSSLKMAVIDETHTAPYKAWEDMGQPAYPTPAQLDALHTASQLVWEPIAVDGDSCSLSITAQPESVTILEAVLA